MKASEHLRTAAQELLSVAEMNPPELKRSKLADLAARCLHAAMCIERREQAEGATAQAGTYTTVDAWQAAIKLAHNICTQEADRINADDGSIEAMEALGKAASRIREWLNPGIYLGDLLAESTGRVEGAAGPREEQMTEHYEGFHPPRYCPRGFADCQSLAQIISTGHASFICCGEHDGKCALVAQDRYRFCHRTQHGVDVQMNHDMRDLAHIAAVYSWAVATVAEERPSGGEEQ